MIRDERGDAARGRLRRGGHRARRRASSTRILQTHGPGAIAFYLSGQLTTESQYLANKFAKGCLRTNHVDSNSRLCMASAASGDDAVARQRRPADVLRRHRAGRRVPVRRLQRRRLPPGHVRARRRADRQAAAEVRRRRPAPHARPPRPPTLHLPVKPGTDLALLNGLLHLLRDWGKLDHAFIAGHTEGWDELERAAGRLPAAARRRRSAASRVQTSSHAARIARRSPRLHHVLDDGREPDARRARSPATRSSTCTWRPARSASPAAARSA